MPLKSSSRIFIRQFKFEIMQMCTLRDGRRYDRKYRQPLPESSFSLSMPIVSSHKPTFYRLMPMGVKSSSRVRFCKRVDIVQIGSYECPSPVFPFTSSLPGESRFLAVSSDSLLPITLATSTFDTNSPINVTRFSLSVPTNR